MKKTKKILAAALAALMIFTFAACGEGDFEEEVTKSKKKKTSAPEVTTVEPATTSSPDVTTVLPNTTTTAPEVTTAPKVTTENTAPETTTAPATAPQVPTGIAQLLNNANNSISTAGSFVMKSTSKTVIEVSGEKVETVEYTTVTLRKVGDGYEAVIAIEYDNDEAVSGIAYYKDGMIYSSYEDTKVCYELSAEDFRELVGLQEDNVDYSLLFSTFTVSGKEDGTTVIGATDFTEKGKDYVSSVVGDLGDTDITYPAFSIEMTVDNDGNMHSLSMHIVVEASADGVTARVSADSIQEYSKLNGVDSIDFPSFDGYERIDNM